jgi:excisionase family DNA binding protein
MPSPSPLVFTVAECAAALKVSEASIRSAIKRGDLPSFTLGRRVLVPKQALEQLLFMDGGNNGR